MGVFPRSPCPPPRRRRLPHACGGVSVPIWDAAIPDPSSPRMWGCFLIDPSGSTDCTVFPTHVGVFLLYGMAPCGESRLPHACGGVSTFGDSRRNSQLSSPRMWGCFQNFLFYEKILAVFPTHVGVFLSGYTFAAVVDRLPHACGGVSPGCFGVFPRKLSSPRMWGCFSRGCLLL